MKLTDVKHVFYTEDVYKPIRESDEVRRAILITPGGSYAYGTNISNNEHESDIDIRGIFYNTPYELLTRTAQNKPYEGTSDLDVVLYPLAQMFKLLCDCNPNIMEVFGVPNEAIIYKNKLGDMILDNLDLFLTKRAAYTFGGMATHNLHLMQNILSKKQVTDEVRKQQALDSLNRVMIANEEKYKEIIKGDLKLFLDKPYHDEHDTDLYVSLNVTNYPLENFIDFFKELDNTLRNYRKAALTHRNNKKDDVHMYKHIMHTLRVLIMGTEILEGKGVHTYRTTDRHMLLDIRNKVYTYEELFEMVDVYTTRLRYATEHTNLPAKPDIKKVLDLYYEMNKIIIKEYEPM